MINIVQSIEREIRMTNQQVDHKKSLERLKTSFQEGVKNLRPRQMPFGGGKRLELAERFDAEIILSFLGHFLYGEIAFFSLFNPTITSFVHHIL